MGTMLQDRTRHETQNRLPPCTNRAKRKASASASSRRKINKDVIQNAEKEPKTDLLAAENGLRAQEMRTMTTAAVIHKREILSKPKYQAIKTHPLERRCRQNAQQSSPKDTVFPRLPPVSRHESTDRVTHEESDSGSDLSDTERLPHPALTAEPPVLHLREEIIHPSDYRPSHAPSRSNAISRESYPDFLPPPFNSWSLRELAVYLNTDGKNVPRSRPVSQFERYLDRLLQLEWRRITTLHDESDKSTITVRRKPHSNLSAPKSILQCQRAFPFTLLTSVHPQTCNRHSGSFCTYPHHSLTEKNNSGTSRRSSSETRAHRSNRLFDPSLDHVKRMQAVGNIRNPATHDPHLNVPIRQNSGGRSRSCGAENNDGCRRTRPFILKSQRAIDSKSLGGTGSENRRIASTHKRVEFQEQ